MDSFCRDILGLPEDLIKEIKKNPEHYSFHLCKKEDKQLAVGTHEKMKEIYKLEQNIHISSFWDSGYTFKIGDKYNGYKEYFSSFDFEEGINWLYEKIVLKGK